MAWAQARDSSSAAWGLTCAEARSTVVPRVSGRVSQRFQAVRAWFSRAASWSTMVMAAGAQTAAQAPQSLQPAGSTARKSSSPLPGARASSWEKKVSVRAKDNSPSCATTASQAVCRLARRSEAGFMRSSRSAKGASMRSPRRAGTGPSLRAAPSLGASLESRGLRASARLPAWPAAAMPPSMRSSKRRAVTPMALSGQATQHWPQPVQAAWSMAGSWRRVAVGSRKLADRAGTAPVAR